ncbi:MAG: transcription termination/antitermination protein NusA [Anaerolineaceae bacterium]|nr:transcription termination/antitermination protein NusA [Anaerolineaceae bacterium]
MKNEFALAFNELIEERQLSREVILTALESAMVSAYRRSVNVSNAQHVEATVDMDTGKITIFAEKEVVDEVGDDRTEVSLEVARRYESEAELGDMVLVESTPDDFGRVAAQTARQVIQQRMRDAERKEQLDYYEAQVSEIVSGVVQAINSSGLTIGLEKRAEGSLSRRDQIPGERFHIHDRVRALIAEVRDNPRGPQIILSRTHSNFLRRLLENEVPEIYHGIVEVRSISREPGQRAKVAVSATQPGIDPVGACVGIRGVRIQAIVRELHNEKIDVIEWNEDPRVYIAKAISPAKVVGVYLDDLSENVHTATVVVREDQLSLAIGRDGQNARLAARLTGWRIDIKSLSEATSDLLYRLEKKEDLAEIRAEELEAVEEMEIITAKKAENVSISSDEYSRMIKFIERVEKKVYALRHPSYSPEEQKHLEEIRASLPESVFSQNILDSALPEHVQYTLQEAGFENTGELLVKYQFDPNSIEEIKGIGPKAMGSIAEVLTAVLQPEPEVQEPEEEIAEEVVEAVEEPAEAPETVVEAPEAVVETAVEEAFEDEVDMEEEIEFDEDEDEEPSDDEISEVPEDIEDLSFDDLLDLSDYEASDVDDEDEDEDENRRGKRRNRKNIRLEYDPELGETVARHKHRKGKDEWDEWEDW